MPYELVEAAANIQPSNCKINFEIQDRPSERFGVVVGDECVQDGSTLSWLISFSLDAKNLLIVVAASETVESQGSVERILRSTAHYE